MILAFIVGRNKSKDAQIGRIEATKNIFGWIAFSKGRMLV